MANSDTEGSEADMREMIDHIVIARMADEDPETYEDEENDFIRQRRLQSIIEFKRGPHWQTYFSAERRAALLQELANLISAQCDASSDSDDEEDIDSDTDFQDSQDEDEDMGDL